MGTQPFSDLRDEVRRGHGVGRFAAGKMPFSGLRDNIRRRHGVGKTVKVIDLRFAGRRRPTIILLILGNARIITYGFYLHRGIQRVPRGKKSDTVTNRPSVVAVGKPVEGSISTIPAKILELDTIGFDETLLLDESLHIKYIKKDLKIL
jgi:hypothetical protein